MSTHERTNFERTNFANFENINERKYMTQQDERRTGEKKETETDVQRNEDRVDGRMEDGDDEAVLVIAQNHITSQSLCVLKGRCSGELVTLLMDTGACASVIYDRCVSRLRLEKRRGKKAILVMADASRLPSDEWVDLEIEMDIDNKKMTIQIEAIVMMPATESNFDVILGIADQRRCLGNVTYHRDGKVTFMNAIEVSNPGGLPTDQSGTNALKVHLDAEGEQSIKVPDGTDNHQETRTSEANENRELARSALAKAQIPDHLRPRITEIVDKYPGLVRRHVKPAEALNEELRNRTPKATILMKEGASAPAHSPSRMSSTTLKILKDLVEELQAGGLLTPSTSPYATRGLLIPKGNGEFRFVCDYRDLNQSVVRNAYALPNIWTNLGKFEGKRFFSKLDLKSFFFQIPLEQSARKVTAVTTPFGLFEWCVVPQGLCTSPAIAQAHINFVLSKQGSLDKKVGLDEEVGAYIDDLGFGSQSEEEMLVLLDSVLARLALHGIQVRLDKSAFVQSRIQFLGFEIDGQSDPGYTRIRPHPERLKAMLEFPTPTNQDTLRRFLGMTVFVHDLVNRQAEIAACLHPLTQITHWDLHTWTSEHQEAFEKMKAALAAEPFVSLPNAREPFVLRVDASTKAIGGALLQRAPNGQERVVAYISKKFSNTEFNWTAAEKELYALVYAIKKHGHFFHGSEQPLTFVSDHKPLQHYRTWILTPKISRWLDILNSVHWVFEYTKGSENALADCLSRPESGDEPEKEFVMTRVSSQTKALCSITNAESDRHPEAIIEAAIDGATEEESEMAELLADASAIDGATEGEAETETNDGAETETKDASTDTITKIPAYTPYEGSLNTFDTPTREFLMKIKDAYDDDDAAIVRRLREGETCTNYYRDSNGFIYFQDREHTEPRLYIPRKASHCWGVLVAKYHQEIGLHCNAAKTYHKLAKRFHWEGMWNDVKRYVKGCVTCQRQLPTTRRHYLPMAFPTPKRCFEIVCMDHKTGLPTDQSGANAFLVVVDFLSRMAILIPTNNHQTESMLAKQLYRSVWSKWGYPRKLVSDRGSTFVGRISRLIARHANYQPIYSTAGNPKTAAIAENVIRQVLNYLRKFVDQYAQQNPNSWSEGLAAIEYAYNDSVNPRTFPFTPFLIALGRENTRNIVTDVERYFPSPESSSTGRISSIIDPLVAFENYLERRFDLEQHARRNYNQLTEKFLEEKRKKFAYLPFLVGDLVWLAHTVRLKNEVKQPSLAPRRSGPFIILETLPHNDYKLGPTVNTPSEDISWLERKSTPVINGERLARYFPPEEILDETDFENDVLISDVPDFDNNERHLTRTLISAISVDKRKPFVILDLGSGEQSLGKGILEFFGDKRSVRYVSVDVNARSNPTYAWDILRFFEILATDSDAMEVFKPHYFDMIWFSGRCDPFSQANTTGRRDVEAGLALIRAGLKIIDFLKPRVVYMESAHSGPHRLADQPEMKELEHQYHLIPHACSQCHYGFLNQKHTCIWSNLTLSLRVCSRDTPCETLRHYTRHLVTSQNGPSGPDREIPGLSTKLSGRVAPGLIQLLLYKAIMHCLLN